jgi:hypothetical protein
MVTVRLKDDGGTDHGGNDTSAGQMFSITVVPVNDPPVALAQVIVLPEDTSSEIVLSGVDVDGNTLSYQIVTPPSHGALHGVGPNRSYRPGTNFFGSDSFTFTVNDGELDSAEATVTLKIVPVNDPPLAVIRAAPEVILTPLESGPIVISANNRDTDVTLDGRDSSDVDGDPLTFAWFEGTEVPPFAVLGLVTNRFDIGYHLIRLAVSDGSSTGSVSHVLEIVTASEAVRLVILFVEATELAPQVKKDLINRLELAAEMFEADRPAIAVKRLVNIERRVQRELIATNPVFANQLIAAIQRIVDSQIVLPRIALGTQGSPGALTMTVIGTEGFKYRIESSTDLFTWVEVAVVENTMSPAEFIAPVNLDGRATFFRAVLTWEELELIGSNE